MEPSENLIKDTGHLLTHPQNTYAHKHSIFYMILRASQRQTQNGEKSLPYSNIALPFLCLQDATFKNKCNHFI